MGGGVCSDGALFCTSPGRKKLNGETLREALMPLQPAPNKMMAARTASRGRIQFNFTVANIKEVNMIATFNCPSPKNSTYPGSASNGMESAIVAQCVSPAPLAPFSLRRRYALHYFGIFARCSLRNNVPLFPVQLIRIFRPRLIVYLNVLALFAAIFVAKGKSVEESLFATRAKKNFALAQTHFEAEPTNSEAALKLGQAAFDWAEFAADHKQRQELADQGIEACRQVIAGRPNSVAGHYYLGMNLGQLARTKKLGALKLVTEMELEFKIARDLDENFDFAGPDRNLGLLYFEAPGWPTSIGNRSKARNHLQRTVFLKPNYLENHLALLEAFLKWGDKNGAEREMKSIRELWPAAKKELSGEQWESSWWDWNQRWEKAKNKFAELNKLYKSPRIRE